MNDPSAPCFGLVILLFLLVATIIGCIAGLLVSIYQKKKKTIAYLIIVILISGIISTFLIIQITTDKIDNKYEYSLSITNTNNSQFKLIVPIVIKSETEIHSIMKGISTTDHRISVSIVNTTYGMGLEINGTGNFSLSNKENFKGESTLWRPQEKVNPYVEENFDISLKVNPETRYTEGYWCFYSSNNNSLSMNLLILYDELYHGGEYSFNGKIESNGWQEIPLETLIKKVN